MSAIQRVVVTGRGVLSPLGGDWPSFAEAVRAGRHANATSFPGVEPGDTPPCYVLSGKPQTGPRGGEPLAALVTAAAAQAMAEARLERGGAPLDGVGLVMNTALGPSAATEAYLERLHAAGPRASRPARFVDTLLSMPASRAGIALGLRGSTAVLGGSGPFELALDWVRGGRERTLVAGGGEYLSPKVLRYHRVLAERSGGERASLAQGAAFVVLEAADTSRQRAAAACAELLGVGAASEPQDVALPWSDDRQGLAFATAMRAALADAAVEPEAVACVALAAGDDRSEEGELAALEAVFGPRTASLTLLRPKRFLGEALGASAGLSLLATLAHREQRRDGGLAIVNSFEMGGAVSSLIVRAPL